MGRFNWSIKENGGSELSAGTSDSTNFNISCNFPSNTTSSNKTYSVNVKDTETSTEKSIDYVIIPCCPCDILQGLIDKTIPKSGGTHVMGGISSLDCASNVSFAFNPSTASTWITSTSVGSGDGDIKFTFSENTSTSERSCTVTPTIFGNACSSKAFTVTQEGNSIKCYDITNNGDESCEGGSIQFTATVTPCYVDLGLPSGTKWAKWNVGASTETGYGYYYQYGKGVYPYQVTSGQSDYSGSENPLSYSVDTARQSWGGEWHIPTQAQYDELTANTTYSGVTNYNGSGVNGGLFIGNNGNRIFFPFGGDYYNGSLENKTTTGNYWLSTPGDTSHAQAYHLNITGKGRSVSLRNYGFLVRPVIG